MAMCHHFVGARWAPGGQVIAEFDPVEEFSRERVEREAEADGVTGDTLESNRTGSREQWIASGRIGEEVWVPVA